MQPAAGDRGECRSRASARPGQRTGSGGERTGHAPGGPGEYARRGVADRAQRRGGGLGAADRAMDDLRSSMNDATSRGPSRRRCGRGGRSHSARSTDTGGTGETGGTLDGLANALDGQLHALDGQLHALDGLLHALDDVRGALDDARRSAGRARAGWGRRAVRRGVGRGRPGRESALSRARLRRWLRSASRTRDGSGRAGDCASRGRYRRGNRLGHWLSLRRGCRGGRRRSRGRRCLSWGLCRGRGLRRVRSRGGRSRGRRGRLRWGRLRRSRRSAGAEAAGAGAEAAEACEFDCEPVTV